MASVVHHFLPDISLDKDELRNAVLQLENQGTTPLANDGDDPLDPNVQEAALGSEETRSAGSPVAEMSQHSLDHLQPENAHTLSLNEDCPQGSPTGVERGADASFAGDYQLQEVDGYVDIPSISGTPNQGPVAVGLEAFLSPPPTLTPSSVTDCGSLMLRDATRVPRMSACFLAPEGYNSSLNRILQQIELFNIFLYDPFFYTIFKA